MIKVMIVDDRPLFREYLRTNIEWEKYGFTICSEAKNGIEALEKAQTISPDVLLTDINMPLMDGLQLSEKMLEENPDLDIVLITGHSEFEYAKKAIELGVCNYIVKPFEKEELILTLLKLKDNINRVCEADIVNENKERILLELLLQQLIYNEQIQNSKEIEENFNKLDIFLTSKVFTTLVIETHNKEHISNDNHVWKDTIISLVQQMFQSNCNTFVFSDYEGRIIILIEKNLQEENQFIKYDLTKLLKLLKKYLEFNVTIGVGKSYLGFEGVRKSYLEGISALRYSYEIGSNKIIHYNEISPKIKKYMFYSAETNEIILKHLRNGDFYEIEKVLTASYKAFKKKNIASEFIDVIYKGLLSLLFSYIYQIGLEIHDLFGDRNDIIDKLQQRDLNKQLDTLIQFYKITTDFIKKFQNTRSYTLAKGAKEYIKTNYSRNNLSVKDVAISQYINETYMRTIFKKETGLTVSEYITNIRLEKAKELLKTTEYRLSCIAEMVGYSDCSYLSKTFKKNIGISPSKYRNSFEPDGKF